MKDDDRRKDNEINVKSNTGRKEMSKVSLYSKIKNNCRIKK